MTIQNALASLAVADLAATLPWYEKLLGRAPDARPMSGVAAWRFPGGGWLQLYQASGARVGNGALTLSVVSLDQQIADLRALAIDPGQEMGAGQDQAQDQAQVKNEGQAPLRVLMLKDPDGNSIAFAEERSGGPAQ